MKLPVLLASVICALSLGKLSDAAHAAPTPSSPALDHQNIHFESVNTQSLQMEFGGLGSILAITQDPDGFIWIGGQFGLARFDGHRYRVYRRDPKVSTSLCGNYVRDIALDQLGDMWIGTTSGLCRYVARDDNFQSYGTGTSAETSLIDTDIGDLAVGEDNRLYVGTSQGVSVLSADRSRFVDHYTASDGPTGLTDERVEALFIAGDVLWIGTIKGLNRLDLLNQTDMVK